ncbi:MAG: CheR family methyltransferase [Nannocystales bacterium]
MTKSLVLLDGTSLRYTDSDFRLVQALAYRLTGVDIIDRKKQLVFSRLTRLVRGHGLSSIADYIGRVDAGDERIRTEFISAITTHVTSFFREVHHFGYLEKNLARQWQSRDSKRLRVWSAGCSSGEETYSIAMTLLSSLPASDGWSHEVVGTDVDQKVIDRAARGIYKVDCGRSVPAHMRRFFQQGTGANAGLVRVKPEVRSVVRFNRENMLSASTRPGQYDVAFCRNVLIYFKNADVEAICAKLLEAVRPEGYLFLGHSEGGCLDQNLVERVGPTIYRKRASECSSRQAG